MRLVHDDAIEFPNGEGFTPCAREYAAVCDEMAVIKPSWLSLDELSAEDYDRFCCLDNKRSEMMISGHLGKSVRY